MIKRFVLPIVGLLLLAACNQEAPVNLVPKALSDNYTFQQGGNLEKNAAEGVLANDSDPEGESLSASLKVAPQYGELTLAKDGSFSYEHDGSDNSDSFSYFVSDGVKRSESTVTLTLNPREPDEAAPDDTEPDDTEPSDNVLSAVADIYTLQIGASLSVDSAEGVLANDKNPNDQTLTVEVVETSQYGELALGVDGSFTYTHSSAEAVKDSFSYSVTDGTQTSQTTVSLNVLPADEPGTPENAAPTATADAYSLAEGETLSVALADGVLANDSDPEGAALTLELLTAPERGVLNLKADGAFSYTHDHSETLSDSFSYRISDGMGTATATVTLTIDAVEDTPVITKLELAQTHIVKPEGTRWEGENLKDKELHLVGNRAALALFDLNAANNRIVDAVVEAYVDEQKLGEIVLNTPETLPPTEAGGPAYSATAHWATLNKSWLKPGLELRVRANEGQVTEAQAVNVGAPASLTMYTLPFYLFGLDETDIPFNQVAAPNQTTQDEYFAKHPFANLEMVNHPVGKVKWPYIVVGPRQGRPAQKVTHKEQQGDGYAVMSATLGILHAIRNANGDAPTNNQYYAPLLMAKQNGSYGRPGGGLGGGNVGTGDHSYTGIFIHEAGHAFGMPHAGGAYDKGTYPYAGGSLKGSSWGYDQRRGLFQPTFVPSSSGRYGKCGASNQYDSEGRCIKQDPMQGGSGYQVAGDKYTIFSDFNASVVQRYFEGLTTLSSDGSHKYSGGKIIQDNGSPTGYSRWDTLDKAFVPVDTNTSSNGLYGLNKGLPVTRNVPVHTLILTLSHTTPEASQIYPPLSYRGNLLETVDPTNSAQLASIKPNVSEHAWFCHASGCDYTLRVTYADDSTEHIVLRGAFRKWHWSEGGGTPKGGINDATSGDSFKTWSVNVDGTKAIKRIELLNTPKVYDGMPAKPEVLLSYPAN